MLQSIIRRAASSEKNSSAYILYAGSKKGYAYHNKPPQEPLKPVPPRRLVSLFQLVLYSLQPDRRAFTHSFAGTFAAGAAACGAAAYEDTNLKSILSTSIPHHSTNWTSLPGNDPQCYCPTHTKNTVVSELFSCRKTLSITYNSDFFRRLTPAFQKGKKY